MGVTYQLREGLRAFKGLGGLRGFRASGPFRFEFWV